MFSKKSSWLLFLGIYSLLLAFAFQNLYAADPSMAWNTFLGKNGQHLGYNVTVDSSGNVYSVGLTNTAWNTSLFGNPVDGIVYQGGATDGVVAKLNSSGSVQWYRIFGGGINDALSNVKVDSSGNVYVLGYAFGAFTFKDSNGDAVSTPSPIHSYVGGDIDIFVAKLNSDGDIIWYTYLGSTSNDYVYGLDLDASGNVYISGESYRTWHADFDNVVGTNKTSDGYQGYIAKLDNDGAYQWHRFLTTYNVYGIVAHTDGNLYTVKKGLYYSAGWNYPAQVGKYNASTGEEVWSKNVGSGTHDGFGIQLDSSGNIFIKGYSNQSWGSPVRAYSGSNDIYVAKLDNNGDLQWNTFLGSSSDDSCRSSFPCGLSIDSEGNVYTVGHSSGSWGSPVISHSGGARDGFLAKINASDGSLLWNLFLGGSNSDWMIGLAIDSSGNLYTSGYTQQTSWGNPVDFPTGCYYCQSTAKISNSLNAIPVLTAMNDIAAISTGATIIITGTCTDNDAGDTLTITTSQSSGTSCGALRDAVSSGTGGTVSASASCTAPTINNNTTLIFTLSCSDGTETVTDTVNVGANALPTASNITASVREKANTQISLSGVDPDEENISYELVSNPLYGTLSGSGGDYTFNPPQNYSGEISFSYRAYDGYGYSSIQTVTINVTNENDAPEIDRSFVAQKIDCSAIGDCALPTIDATDADGDTLTQTWRKVSGKSELIFKDNGRVDLFTSKAARGTYYVQQVVSDGSTETLSDLIPLEVPNNSPIIEKDEDLEISETTYRDSKFFMNRFKNEADITAVFTDYDDDTLSYSWELLDIKNADLAGFTKTESGASKLRIRMAGDVTLRVAVDDGYGGINYKDITLSIPVPEIQNEALALSVGQWLAPSSKTINITGTFKSPVWPVVYLNKNTQATVSLITGLSEGSASLSGLQLEGSLSHLEAAIESESYDTYSYTSDNVDMAWDESEVDVEIYTEVNGQLQLLSNQKARVGGTTEVLSINGGVGCHMTPAFIQGPHPALSLLAYFLPVLILLRWKRQGLLRQKIE